MNLRNHSVEIVNQTPTPEDTARLVLDEANRQLFRVVDAVGDSAAARQSESLKADMVLIENKRPYFDSATEQTPQVALWSNKEGIAARLAQGEYDVRAFTIIATASGTSLVICREIMDIQTLSLYPDYETPADLRTGIVIERNESGVSIDELPVESLLPGTELYSDVTRDLALADQLIRDVAIARIVKR